MEVLQITLGLTGLALLGAATWLHAWARRQELQLLADFAQGAYVLALMMMGSVSCYFWIFGWEGTHIETQVFFGVLSILFASLTLWFVFGLTRENSLGGTRFRVGSYRDPLVQKSLKRFEKSRAIPAPKRDSGPAFPRRRR